MSEKLNASLFWDWSLFPTPSWPTSSVGTQKNLQVYTLTAEYVWVYFNLLIYALLKSSYTFDLQRWTHTKCIWDFKTPQKP